MIIWTLIALYIGVLITLIVNGFLKAKFVVPWQHVPVFA